MFKNRLEFKSAVVGMVLGDGYLRKGNLTRDTRDGNKSKSNSQLEITHSLKQQEYALYKKSLLEYLTAVSTRVRHRYDERTGKTYSCIELWTKYHPFYEKLRDRMYVEGRKQITEHTLKIISPLGLALWYMDDGTFCYRKRGNKSDYQVYLATDSFSEAEHNLAQYWLLKRFDIKWRVNKCTNPRGNMRYRLALYCKDEIYKLFNIIEPFVVDSMRYKITYNESMET